MRILSVTGLFYLAVAVVMVLGKSVSSLCQSLSHLLPFLHTITRSGMLAVAPTEAMKKGKAPPTPPSPTPPKPPGAKPPKKGL